MTIWNDFVKAYAAKNGITYGCAISKPELKEAYRKAHPKKTKKGPKKTISVQHENLEEAMPTEKTITKEITGPKNITISSKKTILSTIKELENRFDKSTDDQEKRRFGKDLVKLADLYNKGELTQDEEKALEKFGHKYNKFARELKAKK
ncbi:MAG: hypothetical protein EBR82_34300 [Caulobacteraceae bacterium]|nr:hypothetical protein [Caulobacteraceae bacterium]